MPIWLWIVLAIGAVNVLFVAFGTRHQTVRRHPTNVIGWRKRPLYLPFGPGPSPAEEALRTAADTTSSPEEGTPS